MVKTGGSILTSLSLVIMLLSLLPVGILFARKAIFSPFLIVFSAYCAIIFAQHTTSLLLPHAIVDNAFQLIAFSLAYSLFSLRLPAAKAREFMRLLLVSFVSVVITLYTQKGLSTYIDAITIIQATLIIIFAVLALPPLINNRHIGLMGEPAFWVTGGLLCYYGMVLLMEAIAYITSVQQPGIQQQKELVIAAAALVRTLFFIAAAMAAKNTPDRLR